MKLKKYIRSATLVVGVTLTVGCADVDISDEEQIELDRVDQGALQVTNGLTVINGLTAINGLKSANGLATTNGLKSANGLTTINGLTTKNASTTANGLMVDCQGKTLNVTCTGNPDGLLSKSTGLMKNAAGVTTASYLVRCALPSTKTIKIQRWDNALVSLSGEAGVAPEWGTNQCTTACEEKVSACLLALVNGAGAHVSLEMTSSKMSTLGTTHNMTLFAEAVFFGNVFKSPPEAYLAAGIDYANALQWAQAGIATDINLLARSCSAYSATTIASFLERQGDCPIKLVGTVTSIVGWTGRDVNERSKCALTAVDPRIAESGVATECSGPGTSTRTWQYPITTFRDQGWY